MSHGRHRAPVEHHLGPAVAGGFLVAATTGTLLVVTPAVASAAPVVTQSAPVRVASAPVLASAPAGVPTVTVARGDTLGRIAGRVGESWRTLYADNAAVIGPNPDRIFPGQRLALSGNTAAAPAPAPAPPAPAGRHAVTGQHAVDLASAEVGKGYVWGATGPSVFDCSGLTQHVFGQLGVNLPHSSAAQSAIGERVGSLADAQPGDLLFFYSPVGHVGIYEGNGRMIAAATPKDGVVEQAVWATPTVIRRVL